MRHLQLSKSLYRTVAALSGVKVGSISLGAAGHTLMVRALQLTVLANATVGVQYPELSERETAYPVKSYAGKPAVMAFANTVQVVVGSLADNHSVQLAQSTAMGEYRLRYIRCSLTPQMRLLNEALPEFDFDPFTANISVVCSRGSKSRQEAVLRLHGLPIRIGSKTSDLK